MSKRLLSALLIIILLIGHSSCSIFKRGARKKDKESAAKIITDTTAAGNNKPVDNLSPEKRTLINALTPLWNKRIEFSTFSGKAKMHYEGKGQKQEFTTNFRIKKDQIIWASVTALGGIVQVARVYITPDSIKLINYLEKQLMTMPLSEASKVLPVPADFSTLQNLIIGNVLRPDGRLTDATDFGGTLSIQAEEKDLTQQVTYNKADSTIRSLQLRSADQNGPAGMVQYGNYENVNNQKFSTSRAINVINAGEQYYLDMNFNNVEFDKNLDYPFSIPKNYTRK